MSNTLVFKKFVLDDNKRIFQTVCWNELQVIGCIKKINFFEKYIMRWFNKTSAYANVFWKKSPFFKELVLLKNFKKKLKKIFFVFSMMTSLNKPIFGFLACLNTKWQELAQNMFFGGKLLQSSIPDFYMFFFSTQKYVKNALVPS